MKKIMIIIGLVILGLTAFFLVKNNQTYDDHDFFHI